jgi:phage-related protein
VKALEWMGTSREDLKQFPREVQADIGYALHQAEIGGQSPHAKIMQGFGGGTVLEIVDRFQTDTYRAVYTVRFSDVIYVLHCFQKKAKRGAQTPQSEIEAVKRNLKRAEEQHRRYLEKQKEQS